jgi:hypothetical protein
MNVTDNRKDSSLQRNLSHQLHILNIFIVQAPGGQKVQS